ncbi:unnamed protein product [Leptosia nina]|uniref:Peptidase M14 domain-containing protein n=1 Tax=Leptosia nina TaxID=320188 RepID=A0AAV1JQU0_9NEOP
MERAICILLLVGAVFCRHEKYEGHQLYLVSGNAHEFESLESRIDFLSKSVPNPGILEILLRLAPHEKNYWLHYFNERDMKYQLIAENLADVIRDEELKLSAQKAKATSSNNSMSWDRYYNYREINDYLDSLGAKYPEVLTVINAGLSFEGRQIKYVRISTSRFEELSKPVIVIEAAAHAREWVTAPVALYLIHKLVVNVTDRDLVENFDWVIIPMVNPDGYDYSMKEDRMWRNTRSTNHPGGARCPGVDANRNFDFEFGSLGSGSDDPCKFIAYEGPSPFSEPETKVVRDAVYQHLNKIKLYISAHSFGNLVLYSWGNNGTLPSNGLMMHTAGVRMAQAMDELKLPQARSYIVGNAAKVIYRTTGTSMDWSRAIGIPLTYALELPGYMYAFMLPPEYLDHVVVETYAGLAAGARYARSIYN